MERFKELVEKANRSLNTADHLAYVTYPVINEPKLTITILNNIYQSLLHSIDALLYYDYLFKRVSFYPKDEKEKIELFRKITSKHYNIDREHIILIDEIKNLLSKHKESPIEFIRKDQLVICSTNYNIQTISINKIKDYLSKSKEFVDKINRIHNGVHKSFR